MKWLALLLAMLATNAGAVTALVSPKHAEQITSLKSTYGVQQVKDLGAAKLIVYGPVAKKLAIPGAKGIVPFAAPVPSLTLAWDYPADQIPLVAFQLYAATVLTNFPPLTNYQQVPNNFFLVGEIAGQTTYQFTPGQPQMFFIVRARVLATGALSAWNQP